MVLHAYSMLARDESVGYSSAIMFTGLTEESMERVIGWEGIRLLNQYCVSAAWSPLQRQGAAAVSQIF